MSNGYKYGGYLVFHPNKGYLQPSRHEASLWWGPKYLAASYQTWTLDLEKAKVFCRMRHARVALRGREGGTIIPIKRNLLTFPYDDYSRFVKKGTTHEML